MNSRSIDVLKSEKSWSRRPSDIWQSSRPQKSESLQSAWLHSGRNMSGGLAQSSKDKTQIFAPQDLYIDGRGQLQEHSTIVIFRTKKFDHSVHAQVQERHFYGVCLPLPRLRNCTPRPLSPNKSLQRTAGHIKCLAAGVDLPASSQLPRARVLTRQLAVAELNR